MSVHYISYHFLFFLLSQPVVSLHPSLPLFLSIILPPQFNDERLLAVPGEKLRLLKVIYVTNQALICQPSLFISVAAGHQCCGLWGVDICCFVILIAISGCVWVIRDGGTGPWQYGHLSERGRERMRKRDCLIVHFTKLKQNCVRAHSAFKSFLLLLGSLSGIAKMMFEWRNK